MPREKLLVPACDDVALPRLIALATLVLVLAASAAWAQSCGPPVPGLTVGIQTAPGMGCAACWTAVTTHTDGSPITGALSYLGYVYQGTVPVPGQTTPTFMSTTTQLVKGVCVGLTPGQHYNVAVTAFETTAPTGSQESALSAPFPFVADMPRKVGGLGLR